VGAQITVKFDHPCPWAGHWLGQNRDPAAPSPVVDDVMRLTGQTCTIFQRLNEAGDMIRVCTNVQGKDGRRAIGTFIPRSNPDGAANPVIAAVLKGETYRGRAFVVKAWYVTAYAPVKDRAGQVIGILYVGVPQDSVLSLRKSIEATRVGESGYAFVIDSKGNTVVGARGTSAPPLPGGDGDSLRDEVCKSARALASGETADQRYTAADGARLVRYAYNKPRDWVIGVSVAEEELARAEQHVADLGRRSAWLVGGIAGVTVVLGLVLGVVLARGITRPIGQTVGVLEAVAAGDLTRRVNMSSRDEVGRMAAALNTAVDKLRQSEEEKERRRHEDQERAEREREQERLRAEQERQRAEAQREEERRQAEREKRQAD